MQALLSLQGNLQLSSNALVVIHTSIKFNISMCVEKVFVWRVYLCYKLHGADSYIFIWAYLMPSPELCISNLCSIRTHLDSLSSIQWQTSKKKAMTNCQKYLFFPAPNSSSISHTIGK